MSSFLLFRVAICGLDNMKNFSVIFAVNRLTSFPAKNCQNQRSKNILSWKYKVLLSYKVSAQSVKNWKTGLKEITC